MRTLTFKAQPTNTFFATVNQVFGDSSQLPTTVERAVIKSLSTVQITKQCSAVVGSQEESSNIWLTAAKNPFVGWALNFRVRMLLKGAVMRYLIQPALWLVWCKHRHDSPHSLTTDIAFLTPKRNFRREKHSSSESFPSFYTSHKFVLRRNTFLPKIARKINKLSDIFSLI